jgi:hypothetical protein
MGSPFKNVGLGNELLDISREGRMGIQNIVLAAMGTLSGKDVLGG